MIPRFPADDYGLSHRIDLPAQPWPPGAIPACEGGFTAVDSDGCAVCRSGRIVCWGDPTITPLGPFRGGRPEARWIEGIDDAVDVAVGHRFACARRRTGGVRCWGWNHHGQRGNGRRALTAACTQADIIYSRPCFVFDPDLNGPRSPRPGEEEEGPTDVLGLSDAIAIAAGADHACALRATGEVVCWGGNDDGELGSGELGQGSLEPRKVLGLGAVAELVISGATTLARLKDGRVMAWGADRFGWLGTGSRAEKNLTPRPVLGVTNAVLLRTRDHDHCVLRKGGDVLCWGRDFRTEEGRAPLRLTFLEPAERLWVGGSVCAQPATGPIRCVAFDHRDSPAMAEASSAAISMGPQTTCSIDAGGALTCWGDNTYAQVSVAPASSATAPAPEVLRTANPYGTP